MSIFIYVSLTKNLIYHELDQKTSSRDDDSAAAPHPLHVEKLDTIIEHLGNISHYLQRLCEYQESESYEGLENPDENRPPPPSDTSRAGSPPFRRPPTSPLSSPHPTPTSHRQEVPDVVMAPPPREIRCQTKHPDVILIQATPDNSQKLFHQVTQLHPTPERHGDVSVTGPAADVPFSPHQSSSLAAIAQILSHRSAFYLTMLQ